MSNHLYPSRRYWERQLERAKANTWDDRDLELVASDSHDAKVATLERIVAEQRPDS